MKVMMARPTHVPVLPTEAVEALQVRPGGRYVDCTLGGGGHAAAILERCQPDGELLGIDADSEAIEIARERLEAYRGSMLLDNDNFANLQVICIRYDFLPVNGILFDLGLSSLQLESDRGFSFQQDSPLDMRFDTSQEITAADVVNTYSEAEMADLIWRYGEETNSRRIARFIIQNRPLRTTRELAEIIGRATGGRSGKIHPATRTFQALRIAVNRELENLESALRQAVNVLGAGGRLVVISYHSLEDRIVKQFMQRESRGCLCPPGVPVCVCDHVATLRILTRKVVTPSAAELKHNPRSRSAKMRVAERIAPVTEEHPRQEGRTR